MTKSACPASFLRRYWRSPLLLLAVFGLAFNGFVAEQASSQEAPSKKSKQVKNNDELDLFRGCSLGIRIEKKNGKVRVDELHKHVAKQCPLKPDDELVSVGDLKINTENLDKLSELLSKSTPDSKIKVVVKRDKKVKTIDCPTFRKQLVDVAAICDRLRSNAIIKKHLKATDRGDYLQKVEGRMSKAVIESKSPREAAEAINSIIDEINVSHTAIMPPQSFSQLKGEKSGDLGFTLQRHVIDGKQRYFVIDRMPGSAGYDSKIKLGDEIISLNAVELNSSRRLILSGQEHRRQVFFIQVGLDESVTIEYRRRQNAKPRKLKLKAEDAVKAENVIEQSARVLKSGKNRYGYIRFWNLMSMKTPKLTREVINGKFSKCDMLILDLRGRGGLIPVVLALEKVVRDSEVPVIAITDDLTRSAKEMLSLLIKKQPHVTVVGQTTAGAVTGATMEQLPSGYGLMFPALSADSLKRFTGNVILEGAGVEPDIAFDFQIPFCGGNDRLLEAAMETADEQIQEFLESLM